MPVHLYGYVDEIPTMMGAADVLLTKAGGLILAESLAFRLDELRDDIRTRLATVKRAQSQMALRNAVAEAISRHGAFAIRTSVGAFVCG